MRESYYKQWFKCPFYPFDERLGRLSNHILCQYKGFCANTAFCNGYGYMPISNTTIISSAERWFERI